MTAFHDTLFPLDIAIKSNGGPERRTEIVTFGSGHEHCNARWAHSRRRYDAGYGVKTLEALQQVVAHRVRAGNRRRDARSVAGRTDRPLGPRQQASRQTVWRSAVIG